MSHHQSHVTWLSQRLPIGKQHPRLAACAFPHGSELPLRYTPQMAQKTLWLTWLPAGDGAPPPQPTVQALHQNGFAVQGAPWIDAPADFAWAELGKQLAADQGPHVWVLAGRGQDFAHPDHRFGTAMIAALLSADRKQPPHIVLLGLDGPVDQATLPTLLQNAILVDAKAPGFAAKILIATTPPPVRPKEPFRLRVSAHKMFGLWLEVGPATGSWQGAMVGAVGAKPDQHAVGPRGGLPERTVLHYKLEGLELEVGGETFVANAVQNPIGQEDAYYVRLAGRPSAVLIGQHPDVDSEVSVLRF